MKKLSLSLFLISGITYGQGDPAPYIKGQAATGLGNQASTVFVPNQQSTKINAYQARIETGNGNLLSNPSFEAGTYNSGWTCSLGSTTLETTAKTDGNKANAINSTGAGVRCYQTSTTNAANLKGLLGSAILKVKTTDSIYKVCGLVDGNAAANERNCITVNPTSADLVFYPARTDFYMGGTSNGIVVYTTTTTSQPTVIDDAFVGVFNGGISTFSNNTGYVNAGAITIGATTSAPTKGTTATDRIMWSRASTNIKALYQYRQTATGAVGSGDYLFSLPVVNGVQLAFSSTVIPYTGTPWASGSAMAQSFIGTGSANNAAGFGPCNMYAYDTTRFRAICQYGGTGATTTHFLVNSTDFSLNATNIGYTFNVDAPIAGWEANTNAAIAGCVSAFGCENTATATSSATGVVSADDLKMFSGNCVVTSTNTYTCPFVSGNYTVTPKCFGTVNSEPSGTGQIRIVGSNTNTSQLQFQTYSPTGVAIAAVANISCTKSGADFKPKTVVVSPLQGYGKYVGAENLTVEKSTVSFGTTTLGTVCSGATCTLFNPIGSLISSITRSSTGVYALNTNKTVTTLSCMFSKVADNPFRSNGSCSNCSTLAFRSFNAAESAAQDGGGTVECTATY